MSIIWPGTSFNGRTCKVTNGSANVEITGNLALDLGGVDPGAAGMAFRGPDETRGLFCITAMSYDNALSKTMLVLSRVYTGATVASGGDFDIAPMQGFPAAAAYQLKLLQTLLPDRIEEIAAMVTIDSVGKAAVQAATTAALPACTYANGAAGVGATLTGNANGALPAQSGVTLTATQRLMVKNEAAGLRHGLYALTQVGSAGTPFVLTRATDYDSPAEIAGAFWGVGAGTLIGTLWMSMIPAASIVVGTTDLTPAQLGGFGEFAVEAAARAAADEVLKFRLTSPFLDTVEDEYMLELIQNVSVERGVAGRNYVQRWRSDTDNSTYWRLQFYIYDPIIGENICTFQLQEDHDFSAEIEGVAYLINAAVGSPYANYTGTSATVWFDPAKIDFTKGASNETDPAVSGIKADRVLTTDQTSEMLFHGKGISNRDIFVGAGAGNDFATIQEALASLLHNPASGRGWFPFSYTCTPSAQVHIRVELGHEEEWLENVVDQGGSVMIAQGMLVWAGVNIYLQPDTVLHTTGSVLGGPLFEWGYGGRLIAPATARMEQRGTGYVFHIDAGNTLSIPATVGIPEQFYRLDFRIDGGTVWVHDGHIDWIFGRGVSDNERGYIWNQYWVREAGSATTIAYYGSHTSANSINPGRISFKNIVGNADDIVGSSGEFQLTKSHVQTVRHEISIENSEVHKITMSNSQGGNSGFVRLGALTGITIVDGSLDQV